MAQTTTLAASGGSTAVDLRDTASLNIFQLTVTSGSSGLSFIQISLDDSSTTPPMAQTWASISSAIASSAIDGGTGVTTGIVYTLASPVSAARIFGSSTALAAYNTTATLKVLQVVGG